MNTHIAQLIISYADSLNLPIVFREDENGNVILESQDKIDLFGIYKQIIQDQLSNKMVLIDQLTKEAKLKPKLDIDRLRMQDEALKLKRESLDLQVEYVAKSDYIFHYQGRLEFFKKHSELLSEKVNKELPDLVEEAQVILGEAVTLATKNHAILTRLIARYSAGVNTQNEKNNLYTSMKNMVQVMGKKDDIKKTSS